MCSDGYPVPEGMFGKQIGHFLLESKSTMLFKSYEHFYLLTTDGPTDVLTHVSVYKMSWAFKCLIV